VDRRALNDIEPCKTHDIYADAIKLTKQIRV